MPPPREQMVEVLRKAEQARDLLSELERHLAGGNTEPERYLTQLDQLAQSLPEADSIRSLIERAVGAVRTRNSIRAASDVSRSRSAIEGEIKTLRGAIESIQASADT
jgi:chromosome segregation ATPase